MKKAFKTSAVLLALCLGGFSCSSHKASDDVPNNDDAPAADVDAGTDAVPNANPETPDANAAQADQPPADQPPAAGQAAPAPAPTEQAQADAPAPTPASNSSETYTVHRGDTLMRIAFEHYGDLYKWKAIYEANQDKIKNPNLILVGTVLKLDGTTDAPPEVSGDKYKVKNGDTLATISKILYGTASKWKEIWKHNKSWVPDPNKIFAGFFIYYTPGENQSVSQDDSSTPNAASGPQAVSSARSPSSSPTNPTATQ